MSRDRALLRTLALTSGALAVALVVAFFGPSHAMPGPAPPQRPFAVLLQVKLFFSTFTTVLLFVLLVTYARIYRDFPNRFTLSLLLFTVSLTFYALTANPLTPLLFGFDHPVGGGPFTFLPDLFASVAVVILLYQSYK